MESKQTVSFLDLVWQYKYWLGAYVLIISTLSFTGLYVLGVVPKELRLLSNTTTASVEAGISAQSDAVPLLVKNPNPSQGVVRVMGELPAQIIIDKIGVNATIANPTKSDIETLNDELLKGVVRYPGSGTLGQGNMFVFGHSSHLRVINNQAYKAFNNLEDLDIGDKIRVRSRTKEYIYTVRSVALADSEEVWVDLSTEKNMLTLSTCDVFGQKQDRYVVQAIFESSINI